MAARILAHQDDELTLIPRGAITVKGKGKMNTFWLPCSSGEHEFDTEQLARRNTPDMASRKASKQMFPRGRGSVARSNGDTTREGSQVLLGTRRSWAPTLPQIEPTAFDSSVNAAAHISIPMDESFMTSTRTALHGFENISEI